MEIKKLLLTEYKDYYKFGHERRGRIEARVAMLITPLIGLAGAVAFYLNQWPAEVAEHAWAVPFYWFLTVLCAVFLGIAGCYVVKSLIHYKYGYVSGPAIIEEYKANLERYNSGVPTPEPSGHPGGDCELVDRAAFRGHKL